MNKYHTGKKKSGKRKQHQTTTSRLFIVRFYCLPDELYVNKQKQLCPLFSSSPAALKLMLKGIVPTPATIPVD